MSTPLIETFTIPITEWKTVDAGKNTIRIKGVALKGDIVSKNLRHYLVNEVRKSTNTFIGKPINIHHNSPENERTNIGHLTWMDWDDTAELLTYEGEITKQPYVDMIRNKSTEIRGVSVQAKFLHNRCPDCNSKFYGEKEFQTHMWETHFKKVSAVPHGIIGEALTLVLSPEVPGYEGSTVNLAEIARLEVLRLSEMITNTEKEKEEYMSKLNVGVTPRKTIAVGAVAEIKEAKPPEPAPSTSTPKQTEPVTPTQTPQKPEPLFPSLGSPPITPKEASEHLGIPYDAAHFENKVIEIVVKPAETLTLKESKLVGINEIVSTKLSLGEPFAEYENFEVCVKANQDKDNPEAYCGKIKHETEEIYTLRQNVKQLTQKLNEVITEQNKPITLSLPEVKAPADDISWKETKPFDPAPLEARIAEVEKKIPEAYNDANLKTELTKLAESITSLTAKTTQIESDLKAWTATADNRAKELFTQIKTDQATKEQEKDKIIKELQDKLAKTEGKLQETLTLSENNQDKLASLHQFKGHSKGLTETANNPVLTDPLKETKKQ